ncbi:MAG: hypothetical protein DBP02_02155 [gamma proteobacterium symbiont of Ctena orbiculata]|nr:MAG: hypothetical protein DBP02_02155 [gamma proteobacterium symbiont of Ctena orbiculata]
MTANKIYDAGDPDQVKSRKKEAEKLLDAEYESLKYIMVDERGRTFIWWLLTQCHVYNTSFTGNSQTFFLEGERNVGLQVIERLHAKHLDDYLRMMKEHATNED